MRNTFVFVLFFAQFLGLEAQGFPANATFFGANNYIEYFSGTLPVILSSPHGGDMDPASIPDRNCSGCVTVNDAYTQDLTREIDSLLFLRYGCHPHMVINRLRRIKLDANREIVEAAQGNTDAEQAWNDFHNFIQAAKDSITHHYGAGLFIDVHGHAHSVQRLELGYMISKSNLQKTDSVLEADNYGDYSSIRNLSLNNLNNYAFSELLRGPFAFGTYCVDDSFPTVPSAQDPFPLSGESYFSGGYNTNRHGSRNGGTIDAIQIECNQDVRFNAANRLRLADSLGTIIMDFLDKHYFSAGTLGNCSGVTEAQIIEESSGFIIYPNPARDRIHLEAHFLPESAFSLKIINLMGQLVHEENDYCTNGEIEIDIDLGHGASQQNQLPSQNNIGLSPPASVHFIILESAGKQWTKKLLIQY